VNSAERGFEPIGVSGPSYDELKVGRVFASTDFPVAIPDGRLTSIPAVRFAQIADIGRLRWLMGKNLDHRSTAMADARMIAAPAGSL
jgi:hypothetical protein